ncbi:MULTISPECIES: hypothetical protein [Streptomyces]|uniref:hypothetical protein n=1 Tax=Streptomyces TaxID=1883 RepID=UPI000D51DF6E|nr:MULTISPECIES: hypothetical protein [Streptomyces]MXG24644.1 hypothetical protein [Streptomyces sp. YIM 132580]NYS18892.1 hypothetical protein [Streptomyces sp. SJ1-7]PVC72957.1 hypothetical protein DBP15_11310 [Streptomyces sp. CS065A]
MVTPQRAEQPQQQPTPSALSMKDLLAAGAAATAVSTPPSEPDAAEGDEETGDGSAERRRAA